MPRNSKIYDVEKRTFLYLCGFSFFLPISKAVGNIFLALAILGMLHRLFLQNDDVKFFGEYKKIFCAIGILMAAVFVSALSSGEILYGVRKFLEKYILHIAAMLPVLFISCDKQKILTLMKILLAGVFVSNLAVVAQGFRNFDAGVWRFGGFLGNMAQGSLIAMTLPAYTILIMHVKKNPWRIFLTVSAAAGFLAFLFNGTRGVWLSTAFLIPAVILIYARNKFKALGISAVILLTAGAIFFVTPALTDRLATIPNLQLQANSERLLMWRSALNMFEDNPIFGVGYGQYKFAYRNEYILPEAKERDLDHAHNNIIQMFAECGIIGGAAFIFMWGYFSYFSLSSWLRRKKIAWLIFFCALWGMMLHGLTEFNFETAVTSKFFWYALGLCIACDRIKI